MGLAYNLDTTTNPYIGLGLSNYLVKYPELQVKAYATSPSEIAPDTACSFFDQLQNDVSDGLFANGWNYRFCGKRGTSKQACQAIFPTGEYIIRDITFVNGYYALVGSYKATFLDLFGAGNHGEAWDGFLIMYRGFSDNFFVPFDADGNLNFFPSNTGIGFLPMRMPYDIPPKGTSVEVAAMDDVGLYAVDVWRGSPTETNIPQPGGGDPIEAFNICLWLGGTQSIDNTSKVTYGIPYANIDRIAFGMVGIFGSVVFPYYDSLSGVEVVETLTENYFTIPINERDGFRADKEAYSLEGGLASASTFNSRASQVIKMNWTGTDTIYNGAGGQVETVRKASIRNSMNLYATERAGLGAPYDYARYSEGWLPNGVNLCTGDTIPVGDHTDAEKFNYYPRRFMDIAAYGTQILNTGGTTTFVNTPAQFVGDCWVGTDDPSGANPQAKIYPMFCGMALDQFLMSTQPYPAIPGTPICFLPPFMTMGSAAQSFVASSGNPSIVVEGITANCVRTEDGAFTYNYPTTGLENSYFAFCTIPYEEMQTNYSASFNPSGREPLRYFFLNGLKFRDNTIGTGIFYNELSPFQEGTECKALCFTGSVVAPPNSETPIPIKMANKWTGKAIQTRTFTVQEEENAKSLYDSPLGVGGAPIGADGIANNQMYNSRNGETVGIKNNYPRLGINPFNPEAPYDPALNEAAQQGAKTGEAVGVLGWRLRSDAENPIGGAFEVNLSTDCTPIKTITLGTANNISAPPPAPTYFVGTSYNGTFLDIPPCSNNSNAVIEPTAVDGSNLITALSFTSRGDGWQVGQEGYFITGTSSTGAGVINGNMQKFTVDSIYVGGLGYTTGIKNTTTLTGSGSGLRINVSAVSADGEITAYAIITEGSGYKIGDTVSVNGGGSTTAILTINQINRNDEGIEPTVFLMDSGGGWVKSPDFPVGNPSYSPNFNYSNARQDRGETFNNRILKDPNSNLRMAINCCWDNDRDQWIFLFGNYTPVVDNQGISIVSVTSTFTDSPRFGSAYLDQTANLGDFTTDFNSGLFQSFPMTNNLDGIIIFGDTNASGDVSLAGDLNALTASTNDTPMALYAKVVSSSSRAFPTQPSACEDASDPATIPYNVSRIGWVNLDGSTGREAFVWVDYILFDGADAVIATKLRERGMKVTIDSVEWFKRKIINRGDLNIKQEEIEMWMRQQQDEFQMMMRDAERMGRVRKRKKQVSAYALDVLDAINTDFEDKEVQEFMQDYLPKSRPPTPEEEMLERQRKGGYTPQSKSYYDEVFEQ